MRRVGQESGPRVCGERCRRILGTKRICTPVRGNNASATTCGPIAAGRVLPPLQSLDTEWPRCSQERLGAQHKKERVPEGTLPEF